MAQTPLTLTGARVVTADGTHDGWIRIEDGRVSELGTGEPGPGERHDVGGRLVAPGLVDTHIHGGAGHAFPEADPEGVREIVAFNRRSGVTSVVGGLVAATPENTLRQVSALADLCDAGELAGIYLEGPFIARSKCGAHDPDLLRDPDIKEFDAWLTAGRGHVRMITVAPELPGALDLIRAARSAGVVAAVGHTEASYEQTLAAIDAGATVATHVYNAMRPLNHRDPGPIAAVLGDERVTVELILDNVHVHPGAAGLVFDSAGPERVSLVTDAMSATGLGDGEYTLGDLRVRVLDGEARLVENGAIASSTIVLPQAVRNAVALGVPVADAIRSASSVPAAALGLADTGRIEVGGHADLLVLDEDLSVSSVMYRGAWKSDTSVF
ncbi:MULTISPECIES: N-acetylglucosamine-6-phosphate deacetylase [unclassified Nocardiopsis]|uniref:N-acetylglucosamine-6-phosphate deacetylase n=1 Tax=unclassified Nocardiopsis TaxID=2649073 RepID=UPI00066DAE33|nr:MULTISPECIES: N-acetylglucosamine-6-phosphate deacetylase [unclassified Nocardiopsis]MBQ1083919.1 N-acetylglucosamine-6-phosphate deacetylase [Nocardiopsis sp. B62]